MILFKETDRTSCKYYNIPSPAHLGSQLCGSVKGWGQGSAQNI